MFWDIGDKMKAWRLALSMKITICILIMQIAVMGVMVVFVGNAITENTRNSTTNHMETVVEERSQIIENYVQEMEKTLTAYSRAGEIQAVLKNPTDTAAVEAAQAYTEKFSKDINNLEGIYVSEWNTHVLAHTHAAVAGMTTREGDPLKALQDAMLAADGVYNTGIIISPASGQQIISMYRAVYDENGAPIGLVGGGIFTTGLVQLLDTLTMQGMENAVYCMVNVTNGQYIFCEDSEKVGVEAEEEYIRTLCGQYSEITENAMGYTEYEQDGQSWIATYYYMADRGWIFIASDSDNEIFASTSALKRIMTIYVVIALLLLLVTSCVIIRGFMSPMGVIEESIVTLQNFNIADNPKIKKHIERNDELGSIAKATDGLITSLQSISDTLNEYSYSFKEKAESMQEYSHTLADGTSDNIAITRQLSASMDSTNLLVRNVNAEIDNINRLADAILTEIESSVDTSSDVIESAQDMKVRADFTYRNGKVKLNETREEIREAIEKLKIQDIRGEAENSIAIVNNCFDSVISFVEQEMVKFKEFAEKSKDYSGAVGQIKEKLDNMLGEVKKLEESVTRISENASNVKAIIGANRMAIGTIAEKNETTAMIADMTQDQSKQNREMADHLGEIVGRFQR